jgi:hypothetical protein
MRHGELLDDHSSHRCAHQVDAIELQRIEEAKKIGRHAVDGAIAVVIDNTRLAAAAVVGSEDAVLRRQCIDLGLVDFV